MVQNIIIDITKLSLSERLNAASNLDEGCTGNTNFGFAGTTFTDFHSRRTSYVTKEAKAKRTGDHNDIQIANDAGDLMDLSYKLVAEQVNFQAGHDVIKLRSSGGILTSEGATVGVLPKAVINDTDSKIPNEIIITVVTNEHALGTQVFWRDKTANGLWEHEFFAQLHTIHLTLLVSGHDYEIMVAHKGTVRQVIQSDMTTQHCK